MPDLPTLDLNVIEDLRALTPDDNDAFLREIIGIFLDDGPSRIAELEQCVAANDRPKAVRAAHSLKGSAANLGTADLRAAAEKVEHAAKAAADLATLRPAIEVLKAKFAAARTELQKLLPPA